MKRLFALLIAVLMIAATLAACGGSSDPTTAPTSAPASSVVLSDLMNEINTQFGIVGLKVLEKTSDLSRYYRIEEADVAQFAAEMSTASTDFTEVILIEAADSAAAGRISDLLNTHLDAQVNTAKSYSKEFLEMIEQRKVMTSGSFVYLVISEDAAAIETLIASKLG